MANISMDKKYKTRDGKSVRILFVDVTGDWPIVGLVETQEGECVAAWRANGLYGHTRSDYDLIERSPYEDFYRGQPVIVSNHATDCGTHRRYFSHETNGTAYCFVDEGYAWTEDEVIDWAYCRALTAEEQAEYDALMNRNPVPCNSNT